MAGLACEIENKIAPFDQRQRRPCISNGGKFDRNTLANVMNIKQLPPYSGIKLSTSVTFAPKAKRRWASVEPTEPRPPVTSTSDLEKMLNSEGMMSGMMEY